MRVALFCLILLPSFSLFADPWGRDADLITSFDQEKKASSSHNLLSYFADEAIVFHQKVISPADGPRSHFHPSSSQYTRDAMHKYGVMKGYFMGCDRLMRENSEEWIYPVKTMPDGTVLKYDPIK